MKASHVKSILLIKNTQQLFPTNPLSHVKSITKNVSYFNYGFRFSKHIVIILDFANIFVLLEEPNKPSAHCHDCKGQLVFVIFIPLEYSIPM